MENFEHENCHPENKCKINNRCVFRVNYRPVRFWLKEVMSICSGAGSEHHSPGSFNTGAPDSSRREPSSKPGTPAARSSSFECPPRSHPMGHGILPPPQIPEVFGPAIDTYRRNSYKNSFYLKPHLSTDRGNQLGGGFLAYSAPLPFTILLELTFLMKSHFTLVLIKTNTRKNTNKQTKKFR